MARGVAGVSCGEGYSGCVTWPKGAHHVHCGVSEAGAHWALKPNEMLLPLCPCCRNFATPEIATHTDIHTHTHTHTEKKYNYKFCLQFSRYLRGHASDEHLTHYDTPMQTGW